MQAHVPACNIKLKEYIYKSASTLAICCVPKQNDSMTTLRNSRCCVEGKIDQNCQMETYFFARKKQI